MELVFSILHVVTAVFIVGPIAILPMTGLRVLRAGDNARTRSLAKSIRLLAYLSLIVVITGFGVMGMADPKFNLSITTPWVLWSLILYAVALALTLALVVPTYLHPDRLGLKRSYVRAAAGSGIATLSLIAVVVLMVWKP